MKIDLSDSDVSPYDYLSFALSEWAQKHNKYGDLIVDIKTSVLGEDRIIALYDGLFGYDFETDWYEGGSLELLAVCPIDELGELKYKL